MHKCLLLPVSYFLPPTHTTHSTFYFSLSFSVFNPSCFFVAHSTLSLFLPLSLTQTHTHTVTDMYAYIHRSSFIFSLIFYPPTHFLLLPQHTHTYTHRHLPLLAARVGHLSSSLASLGHLECNVPALLVLCQRLSLPGFCAASSSTIYMRQSSAVYVCPVTQLSELIESFPTSK